MYIQMYRVFGGGGVSHLPARAELGGDQDLCIPQHVARSGGSAQHPVCLLVVFFSLVFFVSSSSVQTDKQKKDLTLLDTLN